MTMRKIIGLHGLPRVGKDTIADYLVSEHGFKKFAFATELKIELAVVYGLSDTALFEQQVKTTHYDRLALTHCSDQHFINYWVGTLEYAAEYRSSKAFGDPLHAPRSPRWLMQRWGDYRRSENPDYFVDKVQDQIDVHPCDHIVVSDVRMENEAAMVLHHQPAEIWHVLRPVAENVLTLRHGSNDVLPFQYLSRTVRNDGNIDVLLDNVKKLLT